MAALLITFEINTQHCEVDALIDTIESYPHRQLTKNAYAIKTTEAPREVFEHLGQHLSPQDAIYIITLKRPYYGHGPMELNEWLKKEL